MAALSAPGARAFGAGVLGVVAMMAAARAARTGVMTDLQELAGTMVAPPGTPASRAAGAAAQFVNGGLLAQAYRPALERMPGGASWRTGLALGIVHGVLAGALLPLVPPLHPRVPEQVAAPGPYMANRGRDAGVALLALHGLFGAVVGACLARRRP